MGTIYVINARGTGIRKIGITDRGMDTRLNELQTGSFYDLVVEMTTDTRMYREIERLVHAKFSARHVRGEWFEVSLKEACDAIGKLVAFIGDGDTAPITEDVETPVIRSVRKTERDKLAIDAIKRGANRETLRMIFRENGYDGLDNNEYTAWRIEANEV